MISLKSSETRYDVPKLCVFIHFYAGNDLALLVKLDIESKFEEPIEFKKRKKEDIKV